MSSSRGSQSASRGTGAAVRLPHHGGRCKDGELLPDQQDATDLPANEVQFALVISRMLETVKNDPEARRQMVYDLARYKLQEQFTYADARHIEQMKRALDVAIDEVEKFSRDEA